MLTPLSQSTQRKDKLIKLCSGLPEVVVESAGEHLSFKIRKKIMAYYLFDHHGDGKVALCCKSTLNEQRRLIKEDPDSFFVPAYVGPRGWVAIRLDLETVDWDTVTELLRAAYQSVAPKRLAALVDLND
ncbi:MAG TPA: MmcQ/YjbR family DNA-binding protein [Pyrinomonadaceae bacterium]|jgi:phosphoribosylglycinamide formyltransferase-1|nr:MmcQ/YjbR family DNA-binding protein [Pyrinomonadaceae bacterium]